MLEVSYQFLELLAAVLHILKEVERGATGRQQYRLAGLSQFVAGFYAFFHRVGVAHGDAQSVEVVVQFLVVGTQIDQCRALLLDERLDGAVVVALVLAAHNEHHLGLHRVESIPAGIYVGSL